MRKFTVTVNGQDYDVVVKDSGAAAAPQQRHRRQLPHRQQHQHRRQLRLRHPLQQQLPHRQQHPPAQVKS